MTKPHNRYRQDIWLQPMKQQRPTNLPKQFSWISTVFLIDLFGLYGWHSNQCFMKRNNALSTTCMKRLALNPKICRQGNRLYGAFWFFYSLWFHFLSCYWLNKKDVTKKSTYFSSLRPSNYLRKWLVCSSMCPMRDTTSSTWSGFFIKWNRI